LQSGEYIVIPDLVIGTTYTIVEDTGWSWRYSCADKDSSKQLVYDDAPGTSEADNLFKFENSVTNPLYWLDNESMLENQWTSTTINRNFNYN